MEIIHTMPFFIRTDNKDYDLKLMETCFESLSYSKNGCVVLYNQGCLGEQEIEKLLASYSLNVIVLGEGKNVGIPKARQRCFEYIWANFPEVPFISEIHPDMIFPPNWHEPLLSYLENSNEPMISPCILTESGHLHPYDNQKHPVLLAEGFNLENMLMILKEISMQLHSTEPRAGFVHPVIHKSSALRHIGGYDYRFLPGKQGYEDDSLLIAYSYYMGTFSNWRPKCLPSSWVYHAALAQRMTLGDREEDFQKNLNGLFQQYGAYGLKELARIHGETPTGYFQSLFNNQVQ
ncbi:hypothetical protein [Paenibacillus sp. CF384]|uniref:hypothetical protein n=1 Tax=Paenibacillus sp. CF384 TaxID=1884382 RepID=UPI00089C3B83|nr:hypothetical protein [Paenibacillus sp. CF384]SDW04373.1 hypothetical protein SAMN05518855_100164 [Paenibacillus sp. CF384]